MQFKQVFVIAICELTHVGSGKLSEYPCRRRSDAIRVGEPVTELAQDL